MSDTSTLFQLLAADVRRDLLLLLCETESLRVPEGLLTRGHASRRRRGQADREGSIAERDSRTTVELYHTHLPKLAAAELIEWDEEAQLVSRGPAFEEVEPALRVLADNADAFPADLSTVLPASRSRTAGASGPPRDDNEV